MIVLTGEWYPGVVKKVNEALREGPGAEWCTGWFGTGDGIAAVRLAQIGGKIEIEAKVRDDFDTIGRGTSVIGHTGNLDDIQRAVHLALDAAESDQRRHRLYAGFSLLRYGTCEDYLILPINGGLDLPKPPGRIYDAWGWQDDTTPITRKDRFELEYWAARYSCGEAKGNQLRCGEWSIQPWN